MILLGLAENIILSLLSWALDILFIDTSNLMVSLVLSIKNVLITTQRRFFKIKIFKKNRGVVCTYPALELKKTDYQISENISLQSRNYGTGCFIRYPSEPCGLVISVNLTKPSQRLWLKNFWHYFCYVILSAKGDEVKCRSTNPKKSLRAFDDS